MLHWEKATCRRYGNVCKLQLYALWFSFPYEGTKIKRNKKHFFWPRPKKMQKKCKKNPKNAKMQKKN
jgi:hypothetical protein